METLNPDALRAQLLDRRGKLRTAVDASGETSSLMNLLKEVDLALEKLAKGTFGLCETCRDAIEADRLVVDPLIRNCLDHLTAAEQRVLEHDLDLASEVQRNLLPKRYLSAAGWETAFHYEPVGSVSGDYCDLIVPEGESSLYFFLGDVTGKGVAASILMAHLHAIFRSLLKSSQPLTELVERANRLFCEGTLTTHFATLACGRANNAGEIEVCNAGHCFPLVVRNGNVERIPSTGLPLGMFCNGEFVSQKLTIARGDSVVLYSDGLTEVKDASDTLYGEQRLITLVSNKRRLAPQELIRACLEDLDRFRSGVPKPDDITILVVRRT